MQPKDERPVEPTEKRTVPRPRREKRDTLAPEPWIERAKPVVHLGMQVLLSLVLVAGALFVILSGKYDDATQKWAYGIVGTVIGYWLNPKK